MAQNNSPILIPHPESIIQLLNTNSTLTIGGIWGVVRAGQTWRAMDGTRFIWSADGMQVIYSQAGKFYTQTASGFTGDIRSYPINAAGVSAAPWVVVAQTEMKLLMGVVAGASGVGFALVIGTEVAEFIGENADKFETWEKHLEIVLKARELLKTNAPVLYDKVFSAVLKQIFKDMEKNIPDSVTPEIVFFGIGVVIGHVGKDVAEGKFSWLDLIKVVLKQLAIRLLIGVVPQAIKITEAEYQKMAAEIIKQLQIAGVSIQDRDIRQIVEEVQKHPETIRKAFDLMQQGFEGEQSSAATGL
jgi:hypothetical protein